jgi:hypothetical protein
VTRASAVITDLKGLAVAREFGALGKTAEGAGDGLTAAVLENVEAFAD